MTRSTDLQAFLDQASLSLQACTTGPASTAAKRAISIWESREGQKSAAQGERLPVCRWLEQGLDDAASGPRGDLARAFAAIEASLIWRRRNSARPEDSVFWDGHANAMILGPGGLEDRADIWIGATVMAPGVTYVDHDHPPEEVYLSLTPGEWWNAEMDWTDPGHSGFVYNPPGILHRMRAGSSPFLALWFLPV